MLNPLSRRLGTLFEKVPLKDDVFSFDFFSGDSVGIENTNYGWDLFGYGSGIFGWDAQLNLFPEFNIARSGEVTDPVNLLVYPLIPLEGNVYSGEIHSVTNLEIEPFYYFPGSENSFFFDCEYSAPVGEVNIQFPDYPCQEIFFDFYDGANSEIKFFVLFEPEPIYSGEYSDSQLTVSTLIDPKFYSGEYSTSVVITTSHFYPSAVDGVYSNSSLDTRTSFYLSTLSGYSGERLDADFQNNVRFESKVYSGEYLATIPKFLTLYDITVLADGPSAYWKFDEDSGTVAVDFTGNGHNLQYGTNVIKGLSLDDGYRVYAEQIGTTCDGTTTVTDPANFYIISNNATQEIWVKPSSGKTISIIAESSYGTGGTSGQRWAIHPSQAGSGSGGGISVGTNAIQVFAHGDYYLPCLLSYTKSLPSDKFTHIVVSWSNCYPSLYVDGEFIKTGYQARSTFRITGTPNYTYGCFSGGISNYSIYPYALTALQIQTHFDNGTFFDTDTLDAFIRDGVNSSVNILTAIQFQLNALGAELFKFDFDVHPSIDLGIASNLSGERSSADLDISIQFQLNVFNSELLEFDLDIHPSIDLQGVYNFSGERSGADLDISIQFQFDAFDGPFANPIEGIRKTCINPADYIYTGTNGHSYSGNCLTLNSYSSESGGINAIYSNKDLYGKSTSVTFKRTRPGSWYDDDFTDAGLWFCLLPGRLPADIRYLVDCSPNWWYWRPNIGCPSTYNRNSISFEFRYGLGNAILVRYFDSNGNHLSKYLSVISNFTTNEINGTDETRIEIFSDSTGTKIDIYGANNALRQTGFDATWISWYQHSRPETTDSFLIHYHNYISTNTNNEKICDLCISSRIDGFIIQHLTTFDSGSFPGELVKFDLQLNHQLDFNTLDGSKSDFDLTVFLSEGIGILGSFDGVNSNSDLQIRYNLSFNSRVGEYSKIENLAVDYLFDFNNYSGEYSNSILNVYAAAELINAARIGEYSSSELSSNDILDGDIYSGDRVNISVYFRPAEELLFQPSSGEVFKIDGLLTIDSLRLFARAGENSNFSFYSSVSTNFTFDFKCGTSVIFNSFAKSQQTIGPFNSRDGLNSVTDYPTNVENFKIGTGENSRFELATVDILLPKPMISGDFVAHEASFGASGLFSGNFNCYAGEIFLSNWDEGAVTFSVHFLHDWQFEMDFYSTTRFDLTTTGCCPHTKIEVRDLYIEYNVGLDPEVQFQRDKVIMDTTLRASARFESPIGVGENVTFRLFEEIILGQINAFDGMNTGIEATDTLDFRSRVCKGYFIPIGYNLNIEHIEYIFEDCVTHQLRIGEYSCCDLTVYPCFEAQVWEGAGTELLVELVLIWSLNAREGAHSSFDFSWELNGYSGELMKCTMESPNWLFYTGENMHVSLETNIAVRFLERDCLPNDFVYLTPDGDPIPGKYNPAAVEGEPYAHWIKAECFAPEPGQFIKKWRRYAPAFTEGFSTSSLDLQTGFCVLKVRIGEYSDFDLTTET